MREDSLVYVRHEVYAKEGPTKWEDSLVQSKHEVLTEYVRYKAVTDYVTALFV